MIGKTISHYKITAKLGEGGMGVVYKADDTKLGRTVALKFLPPDLTRDEEAKQRFIQEARAASALDHPNICTVYEIDETSEGLTFIAMARYEGESLKAKIERGPLKLDEALDIGAQIAQGLAKAHSQGIIHRDIKPANILITKDGLVKIVDFGLAKLAGMKLTKTGKTLGTAQYMAPEQARGEQVDQRADIWSLGIVLYEMLTGRHAFPGEYEQATLYAIMNEEPEPVTALRTGVPMELERIVMKMLAKKAGERYQHADEIPGDLSRLRRDLSAEPNAPSLKPVRGRARRKRAAMIWIPTCVLVLALAFLLFKQNVFKSAEGPEAKISIAVINFENRTGDASYDNYRTVIPDLLITKLEQSKYLRVATWERLRDLLKQIGKDDVELIDKESGFEACLKGGISAIVTGSFTRAGNLFVTDVKVIDVRTKESLASKKSEGNGVESILKSQIDELGGGIAKAVGLSDKRFEATTSPIMDVTTTSMDAYNYYVMGRKELEEFNPGKAERFLEKAVEIDSTFASAYLYLRLAHNQTGGDVAEDLRNARRFSRNATEKERLYIEAKCALVLEGNPQKQASILRELVVKYPAEKQARYELGVVYYFRQMFEEARAELNQVVSLDPNFSAALNILGYAYMRTGDFEKSLLCLHRATSLSPDNPDFFDSTGDLYFAWGRFEEAVVEFKKAIQLKPDFGSQLRIAYIYAFKEDYEDALKWINQGITAASDEGLEFQARFLGGWYQAIRGNTDESIKDLSRALAMFEPAETNPAFCYAAEARFALSWAHCLRGEYELSRREIATVLDAVPKFYSEPQRQAPFQAYFNIYSTAIDIREGNFAVARKKLKDTRTLLRTVEEVGGWTLGIWKKTVANECALLEAELLLAEGSVNEAMRAGEAVPSIGVPFATGETALFFYNSPVERDVVARAYKAKGDLEKAISEYERLLAVDSSRTDRRLIPPIFHHRLAKLYEEKGRAKEAVQQYQKFLTIMSEADIYQAEIADAKARVARLTAQ
jgi:serine/threonine protein kinase/tetratricopeptide (TPR) repeat protein